MCIPNDYTFDELIIVAIKYYDIFVLINLPNAHLITNVRFTVEYTYYKSNKRYQFCNVCQEKMMQNITLSAQHT